MSIYGDRLGTVINKSYIDAGDESIKNDLQKFATFAKAEYENIKDKKIITIWAEESGPLRADSPEYAFGNGASGLAHGECGYTMMCSGIIVRMGVCSVTNGGHATELVKVGITINGTPSSTGILNKIAGQRSAFTIFDSPIKVNAGSVLNFITRTDCPKASITIVNLLIELDI
jgi:hypothetical protein